MRERAATQRGAASLAVAPFGQRAGLQAALCPRPPGFQATESPPLPPRPTPLAPRRRRSVALSRRRPLGPCRPRCARNPHGTHQTAPRSRPWPQGAELSADLGQTIWLKVVSIAQDRCRRGYLAAACFWPSACRLASARFCAAADRIGRRYLRGSQRPAPWTSTQPSVSRDATSSCPGAAPTPERSSRRGVRR